MNIETLEKITKKIPVASKAGIRPSVPELMPFLIEFLKEYEQSKWVEFDIDDESTWPVAHQRVLALTNTAKAMVMYLEEKDKKDKHPLRIFDVTHWQPLPEILKG
jgi:hypothetical protein